MLRHRVSLTARFLCDKLGETNTSSPIVASCRDAATKDAMSRVETLEASYAPSGTIWVRPSPWDAPYPDDWYTRYLSDHNLLMPRMIRLRRSPQRHDSASNRRYQYPIRTKSTSSNGRLW